ncbi:hypothetical protein GOV12_05700 [Candidatus Pacearchaeota archaeon]|nr:hypothetical protein [Candidatus Pacearchaeota archaeon]
MTIHYQKQIDGGLRAAYIAKPDGNLDQIIREALNLKNVKPRDPLDVENDRLIKPCIIKSPNEKTYYTPITILHDTSYTVRVIDDQDFCIVGISIGARAKSDELTLKVLIQDLIIDRELAPKGLTPIESTRDQIPEEFLGK